MIVTLQVLGEGGPAWLGYTYAVLMFSGTAVGVLADNQHFQRVMRAGFRLKAALAAAVHRQVGGRARGCTACVPRDKLACCARAHVSLRNRHGACFLCGVGLSSPYPRPPSPLITPFPRCSG